MAALRSTRDLGLVPTYEGKVRDMFDLGDRYLIVATDRISAFDVIMNDIVPGRGVVLNVMSLAWFKRFAEVVPNHVLTADPAEFPAPFRDHAEHLGGRSVLVRKARRFDVECVVRGYIAGSGWKSYRRGRHGLRPRAAGGPAPGRAAARAHLHALDQGRRRATTRTSPSSAWSRSSDRSTPRRGCATSPCACTPRARPMPGRAG